MSPGQGGRRGSGQHIAGVHVASFKCRVGISVCIYVIFYHVAHRFPAGSIREADFAFIAEAVPLRLVGIDGIIGGAETVVGRPQIFEAECERIDIVPGEGIVYILQIAQCPRSSSPYLASTVSLQMMPAPEYPSGRNIRPGGSLCHSGPGASGRGIPGRRGRAAARRWPGRDLRCRCQASRHGSCVSGAPGQSLWGLRTPR